VKVRGGTIQILRQARGRLQLAVTGDDGQRVLLQPTPSQWQRIKQTGDTDAKALRKARA
jgi:hypothetical protein